MYDLTVITENEKGIEAVLAHLKQVNAVIKRQTDLGLKPFSYPIEKKKEGIYTTFIIELDQEKLRDLNHDLNIDSKIIRHLIIKTNQVEPIKTAEDQEARTKQYKENPTVKPVVEAKEETAAEKKERKAALDKKLGEILEEK